MRALAVVAILFCLWVLTGCEVSGPRYAPAHTAEVLAPVEPRAAVQRLAEGVTLTCRTTSMNFGQQFNVAILNTSGTPITIPEASVTVGGFALNPRAVSRQVDLWYLGPPECDPSEAVWFTGPWLKRYGAYATRAWEGKERVAPGAERVVPDGHVAWLRITAARQSAPTKAVSASEAPWLEIGLGVHGKRETVRFDFVPVL